MYHSFFFFSLFCDTSAGFIPGVGIICHCSGLLDHVLIDWPLPSVTALPLLSTSVFDCTGAFVGKGFGFTATAGVEIGVESVGVLIVVAGVGFVSGTGIWTGVDSIFTAGAAGVSVLGVPALSLIVFPS